MTHGKLQRNELDAKTILKGFIKLNLIISLLILLSGNLQAQIGNGSSSRESRDTSNNADQNLKSVARVNPSTLAMEFSLPFMSYPGRNGNSLPVGISYSSKLWRMQTRMQWWYPLGYQTRYVTDIYTEFSKHSAAGWTSSLAPPKLVEKDTIYDESGQPYSDRLFNEAGINNHWQNILSGFAGENNMMPCGTHCNHWESWGQPDGPPINICVNYILIYCETGGGGGGPSLPEPPPPVQLFSVKRIEVTMPDGSTHEFRKDDSAIQCGTSSSGCSPGSWDGTYLSVDGSAMKVVQSGTRTLYLPNGSRYEFSSGAATEQFGLYASKYIDVDGNIQSFSSSTESNINTKKWTDTLGREIVDPLSNKVTQDIDVPGLDNDPLKYKVKWENLKPPGCETITDPNCTNEAGQVGGALEDQTWKLYYETRYFCRGNSSTDLLANPNNLNDPNNEVLFPHRDTGIRPCNSFNILLNSLGEPVLDENDLAQPFATRFNPQVLSEVELPNGKKYIFKYNRYGEISKIIYPTGSYETFTYGFIEPMNGSGNPAYDQTNRGVTERRIYSADGTLQQRWQYSAAFNYASGGNSTYKVTTIAPKGDDPLGNGIKTERFLHIDYSDGGDFGFSDPRAGMPKEEKSYDENDYVNPRSRTLTKWIIKNITSGGITASRDPRAEQTVSVIIENGLALATLGKTVYDTAVSTDAEHFSHLNAKSSKGYHYKVIDLNTAQTGSFDTIAGMFTNDVPASVSETDYQYDPNYKARGIPGLPVETRVLNPANSMVIARTQTVYDEPSRLVADSGSLSGNLEATWSDPGTTLRGKPTTGKVWDSDNNYWIETHTQYDQYGNVRKAWEAGTATTFDPTRFVETQYSSDYAFAYPTKVITPAPDPTGMHGTTEGSFATTTYDYTTGLPLTVTNEFGQTMATEYNDSLLRPTRSYGVGTFVIPVSETIYDDDALTVTVRKQIDANNWDEATSYSDSLGRTVKTRSKDSQGDVFAETQYDFLGRVKATTNPYRLSDTDRYFSRPRYDETGRAVESCAPVIESAFDGDPSLPCPGGKSLGTTAYGISTTAGFIGTFVMTTDAAGKKGRAITNALGQLIRIDEPDYAGGLDPLPQSTPNPTPTPNPSPSPGGGGGCLTPENCLPNLTGSDYPMNPTIYKYNEQGKMVEVVQGDQHRYFKYDSLGRLIRVRQPEQDINTTFNLADSYNTSGQWTAAFSYDVLGNVLTATDANGTQLNYSYDKASRVKTRTYSDGTPAVSYFYDGKGLTPTPDFSKGKLTKVTSSVSETRYTKFDYLGRLTESEQRTPFGEETVGEAQARISKYEYNLSGALVKQTYPDGREVRNAFEADGDLSRIYGKANPNAIERTYANSFSYTPDGRIEKLRLGNSRWEWAKFNERLQVTELNLGSGVQDASLWKLKYEYGEINSSGDVDPTKNTGNIARMTTSFSGLTNPFVQTFKYDSLYRLVEAKEKSGANENWKELFSYDRYGNRIGYEKYLNTVQQSLDNKTHPSINPQMNRFNTGQGYTYDLNGNLISDAEGRIFTFNGDNKQSEIKNGTTLLAQYFYDGEGKRVKKKVYNPTETVKEETVFVYDGLGKLIAEYSTAEPPPNPTTSYTATDMLGSPRVITDSQGNVTSRRDFMPFGEELANDPNYRTQALKYNTGDSIRQKFTGYQKDEETNLDFAEARMYENRHARFTAVDPLLASGKSANPQTFNRYVYVGNNPLTRTDPNGTDWYMHSELKVRRNGTSYYAYTPVWYDHTVYGMKKWDKGIYRVGGGKNGGKWIAIDPYNNNFKTVNSRAEAVKAYNGFIKQRNDDIIGGITRAIADTVEGALLIKPMKESNSFSSYSTGFLNSAGINPDESSNVSRTTYRTTNAGIALGSLFGGEVANLRPALSFLRGNSTTQEGRVLFRGVNNEHPAFGDALNGIARPRGGHSDPALHNRYDTRSTFTSWTTDANVAEEFAESGGAVLKQTFPENRLVCSPDIFLESEVLVTGTVTGAKVKRMP